MKNNKNNAELKIGLPVEPMLVSEISSDSRYEEVIRLHKGNTYAEVKSDGNRIQVHKSDDCVRLFSRNLLEMNPAVFPELEGAFKQIPCGIYDGELVGVEDGKKGFDAIQARKTKTLDIEKARKFPLQLKFFDILRLEDNTLINQPLTQRRAVLENSVENTSKQWPIDCGRDLENRYEKIIGAGLEGLVCKDPDSRYLIGKRTKDWIKIKKFITLDLAVLGVYKGEGKAEELPFAALLLGTRKNGNYETIVKVGISNKELIDQIGDRIKGGYVPRAPNNIIVSDKILKQQYAGKRPLYYVKPEQSAIVEVSAMNVTFSDNWHSCGLSGNKAYSLRIPIVQRYRDDKTALDCTSTDDVKKIYEKS